MSNQVMFIVNPAAGHGKTKVKWDGMQKLLNSRGLQFGVRFTEGPMHAAEIARLAVEEGFNCIVAVGGDGTVNEVINGIIGTGKQGHNVFLTVLPMGTGSDLARVISFPRTIEDIVQLWEGRPKLKCDLIECQFSGRSGNQEARFFINIADVGLGSETALHVNKHSKQLGGFASFLRGTISSIISFQNKPIIIRVDEQIAYQGMSALLAVANGRYFGGGMMIAPEAYVNDGLMDVIILKGFSKAELLYNLPLVYKGTHLNHPKVLLFKGRKVSVSSSAELTLEMDGEVPGLGHQATFTLRPAAISVWSKGHSLATIREAQ